MNPLFIFHFNSGLLKISVFAHKEKLLYFVSILNYLVSGYNPFTRDILSVKLNSPFRCIFVLERKRIIVASKNGFFEVEFNTLQKQFSFQINLANSVRYNDGIKDSQGTFIIGTTGFSEVKDNTGKVFSHSEEECKVIIEDTTISNGLAFSQDALNLYYIDTPSKKVAKYAFDKEIGNVSFKSYMVEFNREGSPDGMCMDNEGKLEIAEWSGKRIARWNPENGRKMYEQKLPWPNGTSSCFDNHLNL